MKIKMIVLGKNKLEKYQERAFRFISYDHTSSLNDQLKSTNTQPLHVRRIEVKLVVKLVKFKNSYEGQRAGDLRLEHVMVCTAQPGDRK